MWAQVSILAEGLITRLKVLVLKISLTCFHFHSARTFIMSAPMDIGMPQVPGTGGVAGLIHRYGGPANEHAARHDDDDDDDDE